MAAPPLERETSDEFRMPSMARPSLMAARPIPKEVAIMNIRQSIVIALVFVSSLVACGGVDAPPPPPAAVQVSELESVKGVPDRGLDPAVVAIEIGGSSLCSGSLVAPDVVLTARHCVAQAAATIQCPTTAAQVGPAVDPSTLQILAGDDVTTATLIGIGSAIVAPAGDVLCDADIAFIVLDRSTTDITPLQISTTPVVAGSHVRSVGFGATSDTTPAGIKIVREHVAVQGVVTDEFQIGEATCQGDSGGPAFDETTGQIVGVVSRGGGTCTGKNAYNIYTRTDIFESLFAQALALGAEDAADAGVDAGTHRTHVDGGTSTPPPSDTGNACTTASDCAASVCVTSPAKDYCSRSCGTGDRCPAHFHCTKTPAGTGSVCMETT
jgi:Trypsin